MVEKELDRRKGLRTHLKLHYYYIHRRGKALREEKKKMLMLRRQRLKERLIHEMNTKAMQSLSQGTGAGESASERLSSFMRRSPFRPGDTIREIV